MWKLFCKTNLKLKVLKLITTKFNAKPWRHKIEKFYVSLQKISLHSCTLWNCTRRYSACAIPHSNLVECEELFCKLIWNLLKLIVRLILRRFEALSLLVLIVTNTQAAKKCLMQLLPGVVIPVFNANGLRRLLKIDN